MALEYGVHRSLKLAERHLAAIQRENPRANVHIASRRNSAGKRSGSGRHFTFSITRKKIRRRKRAPGKKLLAFLLSFNYKPENRRSHGGNKAKLRADFIVAGDSALRKRDSVEVFTILIPKVIRELAEPYKWLAHLAQQVIGSERAKIDSSAEPKTNPPKRAKIRSAYRNNKLLYGSPSADEE